MGLVHDVFGKAMGRWRTSGHVLDAAGEPVADITGSDVYEDGPGGNWIVHHVDVSIGGEPVRTLELIGEGDHGVLLRAFEATGELHTSTAHRLADGSIRIDGGDSRATFRIAPGRASGSALWERRSGRDWVRWMDLRFERE
ncbi:hypothetical protein ACFFKU_08585 [Kineococcus gynurae]|uniref:DUF1579 domain-containing protein n=1 Tax=Kineococcus gynurae TaxID=452979 RepID=A0ABV5LW36_9ACTN